MKRLKRYQYERYAILCREAYPLNFDHTEYGFSKSGRVDIQDRWGRTIVRVLWEDEGDIVVVFKGSQSLMDWLLNLSCHPKKLQLPHANTHVHWGFHYLLHQPSLGKENRYFNHSRHMTDSQYTEFAQATEKGMLAGDTVFEKLDAALSPLVARGKRMALTGHSSGGAMAVIAGEQLFDKYGDAIKRIVTFGQPATAFWDFKRHYRLENKTYRVCCDVDIVTFLPGIPLVYWHVGRLLWLHDDRIYDNIPSLVRIVRVIFSWLLRPIAYHYMDRYIRRKDYFDKH